MTAELGFQDADGFPRQAGSRSPRSSSWKSKVVLAAGVGVPLAMLAAGNAAAADPSGPPDRGDSQQGNNSNAPSVDSSDTDSNDTDSDRRGSASRNAAGRYDGVRQSSSQVGNVVTHKKYVDGVPTKIWTETYNPDGTTTTVETHRGNTTQISINPEGEIVGFKTMPAVKGKTQISSQVDNVVTTITYINGVPTGTKSETFHANMAITTLEKRNGLTTKVVLGPNGDLISQATTQVVNSAAGPVTQEVFLSNGVTTTTITDSAAQVISRTSEPPAELNRGGFFGRFEVEASLDDNAPSLPEPQSPGLPPREGAANSVLAEQVDQSDEVGLRLERLALLNQPREQYLQTSLSTKEPTSGEPQSPDAAGGLSLEAQQRLRELALPNNKPTDRNNESPVRNGFFLDTRGQTLSTAERSEEHPAPEFGERSDYTDTSFDSPTPDKLLQLYELAAQPRRSFELEGHDSGAVEQDETDLVGDIATITRFSDGIRTEVSFISNDITGQEELRSITLNGRRAPLRHHEIFNYRDDEVATAFLTPEDARTVDQHEIVDRTLQIHKAITTPFDDRTPNQQLLADKMWEAEIAGTQAESD